MIQSVAGLELCTYSELCPKYGIEKKKPVFVNLNIGLAMALPHPLDVSKI